MPEGGSPARSSGESVVTEPEVVKASGLHSRATQTDTPEFKRWFGDWDAAGRRTLDFFHDATVTPSKEIRQALPSTTRPSMAEGAVQVLAAKDKLYQWYHGVNAATVSKVVDEGGKPLVVYHGTREEFDAFKASKEGGAIFFTASPNAASAYATRYGKSKLDPQFDELRTRLESQGVSKWEVHNHPEWEQLSQEAQELGANVLPVFLSIKRPLEISGEHESDRVNAIKDDPKEIARLKRDGYDGIVVRNALDRPMSYNRDDAGLANRRADLWIAFDPEQVKSATGNRGAFDPANQDIRYSRATAATATLPGLLDNGNVPRVREWFAPKLDAARVKLQHRFLMLKRRQQAEIGFVEPEWVKAIPGGHTAIARVSLDGESRTTLKLYTLQPSKSDQWLTKVRTEGMDEDRVFLHGMLPVIIFPGSKPYTTGTRGGGPNPVLGSRPSPAMVVFGESEVGARREE